ILKIITGTKLTFINSKKPQPKVPNPVKLSVPNTPRILITMSTTTFWCTVFALLMNATLLPTLGTEPFTPGPPGPQQISAEEEVGVGMGVVVLQ
ncbi:2509_t:CDS:2, partial [Scutellospora calospora]